VLLGGCLCKSIPRCVFFSSNVCDVHVSYVFCRHVLVVLFYLALMILSRCLPYLTDDRFEAADSVNDWDTIVVADSLRNVTYFHNFSAYRCYLLLSCFQLWICGAMMSCLVDDSSFLIICQLIW